MGGTCARAMGAQRQGQASGRGAREGGEDDYTEDMTLELGREG